MVTYFDLHGYHKHCRWPIFNLDIFTMFKNMGYSIYVAERTGYESLENIEAGKHPFDNYGISLLLILVKDGIIVSIYSRWNQFDICEKFLNIHQLASLLENNFFQLIEKENSMFKPHKDLTGLSGIIKIFKQFGDFEPVLLYEFKGKKD